MNTVKYVLGIATMIFVLLSCANKPESTEQESGFIEITKQQYDNDAMQLGETETKTFENTVKCNGIIVPLPNGLAILNAPLSGMIKNINCHSGQFVEKNQTLLEITGNEIIDIQKDFAEASANHKRLKSEYNRIKSLYLEKVISEKDFIMVESEYVVSRAHYNGLLLKIEAIGFSDSKIENGEFYTSYKIKAPINGIVTQLRATHGSFINSQSELIEIINPAMFQIQISVFTTDISIIKKGQKVRFKSINSIKPHYATISSVGVALDKNSKSIECYASITDKMLNNSIANEFIECEIITGTDTVNALPSEAIIKTESGYKILVLEKQDGDKYFFNAKEVLTGRQQNGFTEILKGKTEGAILTKGTYNIQI